MKVKVSKLEVGHVRADGSVLESVHVIMGGAYELKWKRNDGQPSYQVLSGDIAITLQPAGKQPFSA